MKKYILDVVYGSEAVGALDDSDEVTVIRLVDEKEVFGEHVHHEFDTEAEFLAYRAGVVDCLGWDNYFMRTETKNF